MKIVIVGAGQVGSTIVGALHAEHDLTVIDLVRARLEPLAYRFDIRTIEANGASRKALQDAGVDQADLFIACTSRDEANLVACSFARVEAPRATIVIRASNVEYHAPARFDELLECFVRIQRLGRTSVAYDLCAVRLPDDELMVTSTQTLVLIDRATRRPTPIPDALRETIRAFEGADLLE